jgi:preprotein translocase subunit YajC
MPNVNLIIHGRKTVTPDRKPLLSSTPYDDRYGFWGMVTELHPENMTVHVRTPEGQEISNVRVSSHIWVTIDKEKGYLSGSRILPPIDTYVLVFMPNGEYSSAVIIASGYSDDPQHGDFKPDPKDKAAIEDAKEISDSVKNSGWKYTEDKRTGTRVLQNKPKDPTIKIEVDQEEEGDEKVTITIHGNVFTVTKDDGIKIQTDKNIEIKAEGDAVFNVTGNATVAVDGDIEATAKGDISLKAGENEIKHTDDKTVISGNFEVSK